MGGGHGGEIDQAFTFLRNTRRVRAETQGRRKSAAHFKEPRMKPVRSVGNVSSLHLPGIAAGLKQTTEGVTLSAEESKRLKKFFVAVKPLEHETKGRMQADLAEAKVGAIDLRVDRNWIVLRDLTEAYARLAGVTELGDEAATLLKKFFADMSFLRRDTAAQAEHGKALLVCLEEEPMSKELRAILRPALAVQKVDHAEYEAAVQESLVTLERVSALAPLRRDAADALQSFVTLAEAMATTNEEIAALHTMLAPVDAILAKVKASMAKGEDKRDEKRGSKADEKPTRPEEPQD